MVDIILTLQKTNPPLQGKRILWPRDLTAKPVRVVGSSGGVAPSAEVMSRAEHVPPHPVNSLTQRQRLGIQNALHKKHLMNLSCPPQSVTFHQAAVRIEYLIMGYRLYSWVYF